MKFSIAALAVLTASVARPAFAQEGATWIDDEARIVIRYAPEDDAVADRIRAVLPDAVAAAQRWSKLSGTVVITVHPTHEALESAARRTAVPWMRAWARHHSIELQSPRTWSRGHASDAQLRQILAHELTHCALFQALGQDRVARTVPSWFIEGMATRTAGQRLRAGDRNAPGDHAFQRLVATRGEHAVRALLERVRELGDFEDAFHELIGFAPAAFVRDATRPPETVPSSAEAETLARGAASS